MKIVLICLASLILVTILLFLIACCVVSGRCSEQEELRNGMTEYEETF